jgi:cell division septum initiation protein DivIVA
MAQPVWVLSVDLQTKTATFQSGMADAVKAAKGSFKDIKDRAGEMGRDVSVNMFEARHGVMLLSEEFGIHLPRALTSFVASLGPIGAAMEAAFPFLAIIVGATLLVEHLAKLKAEGEKLTEAQINFGTVTANVLNALDEKLLQAGIRADELSGNHLDALEKQLQLIDHQSLKELEHSFEELAKGSDAYLAQLKTSWYQFGVGSEGAKHALDEFKAKYDSLLAQGKDKEASDLLAGTLQSAQRILQLQEQARANQASNAAGSRTQADADAYKKFVEANMQLTAAGTDHSDKAVSAQHALVDALQAQVTAQQKINDLKKAEEGNATTSTQKSIDADDDKLARAQADAYKKGIEEQDKADEEHYRDAVERIQQAEREKIAATEQGSQARLNAIDAAIKQENAMGLQETGYYRELLTSRVNTAREMAQEEKKLEMQAKSEEISHGLKMDELQIAAEREAAALRLATKRKGDQERLLSDEDLENQDFKAKAEANAKQIAALDAHEKDYENKLKALQDRQEELTREHENKITAIRDKAEIDRANRILAGERHLQDSIAQSLSSTLMRHQSFATMITSLGGEVVEGMMQNAIKSILADDMTKEHDAAAAARKAFLAGMHFPFPANIVMGPVLGAAAFASVMAFQEGGLVPGVGIGDIVPAKLEPGETVLPKRMTEQLNRAADSGSDGKPHVIIHHSPTYHVQTIDGDGIRQTLTKHKEEFSRHVSAELRRMNR